ncbi:MAG: restriction endonuclease subunit S [Candidatus Liptonbacteria bacterium]|nr:restriction endonuclease subunit S [Candidatus Liptonbacteria bacterium]
MTKKTNHNWQTKKLGEVCKVIAGQSPEGRFYNKTGNGLPFYQGKKEFTEKFIGEPTTWTTEITKEARAGDILMSVRAPVGPINFATEKICIGRGLAAIRASKEIENNFLFNFLHKFESEIVGNAGAVFNSINKTQIENINIPLPPLPEQKRIVAILDEAFAAIATAKENAEKNLQNARAIFESHLQSVFTQRGKGWVEKSLGSLASFRNGINYTKDSKGDRIKIVGVRNFKKNFSAPMDDLDTVTIDGELSELDSLRQDDILAVRSNGNIELIGRCILVSEVTEKVSHSGFTIRIRLSNGEVLPRYLCHFIKSASSRKRLTDGGTGTNIKSLNQGMLSTLAIPFPPISVQKILVEKLESLSAETKKLEAIYQQKLADLDELKKSVLQKAFNGGLA